MVGEGPGCDSRATVFVLVNPAVGWLFPFPIQATELDIPPVQFCVCLYAWGPRALIWRHNSHGGGSGRLGGPGRRGQQPGG